MTVNDTVDANHPADCPNCHHKVHSPEDLIQFKVFRPPADTPTEKLQGVCTICGDTTTMVAAIVYKNYGTGKLMREDIRCEPCFERFNEKYKYEKIE